MESIDKIINRFIDINELENNNKILAFILYGSSTYSKEKNANDVDILLVLNGSESYRIAKMVDGYHLDIHALSMQEIENSIKYERANGNQYIESVLRNGFVYFNKDYTLEYLRSILTINLKRFRREVNPKFASLVVYHVEEFLDNLDNDDYKYFVALELLRKVIHVILGASDIPEMKVFKLYNDPKLADEKYMIKLPNEQFRKMYFEALEEKNLNLRKEYLVKMLDYLVGTNIRDNFDDDVVLMDDSRGKSLSISLNNLVLHAEDEIIKDTKYASALYFLTINRIMSIIKSIYTAVPEDTNKLYENALSVTKQNDRIQALEELFHIVDSRYKIDFDDFVLKL